MVIEVEGLQLVVDRDIKDFLKGITLDYSDSWLGRGFRILGSTGSCS